MLEQAGIVRRGYDAGRMMQIELPEVGPGAAGVVEELLERSSREAIARVDRIVAFAEASRCRHAQVAEHFGESLTEPCGACDICDPPAASTVRRAANALPADVAGAIVAAVAGLRWPLGRRSLVAMLRGSVSAPPSARASEAFGLLEAASDAEVKRWIAALEAAGALVEVETDDGYRVLHAQRDADLPSLGRPASGPVDDVAVVRLRDWRRQRSQADGVPAYVVFPDATLRALAASKPETRHELAAVKGFGPARIERYGDDILALLAH